MVVNQKGELCKPQKAVFGWLGLRKVRYIIEVDDMIDAVIEHAMEENKVFYYDNNFQYKITIK